MFSLVLETLAMVGLGIAVGYLLARVLEWFLVARPFTVNRIGPERAVYFWPVRGIMFGAVYSSFPRFLEHHTKQTHSWPLFGGRVAVLYLNVRGTPICPDKPVHDSTAQW